MRETKQKEQTQKNTAPGLAPIMLRFTELGPDNIEEYRKLSRHCPYLLSCYSAGVLFMWKSYYSAAYALYSGCVIIRLTINNKVCFLYPFAYTDGGDVKEALAAIEKYTSKNSIPYSFYAVPRDELPRLALRYTNMSFSVNRNESEYIYAAGDMKSFAGRKYSGRRNQVRRFKKRYPDAVLREYDQPADHRRLQRFWERFEAGFKADAPLALVELEKSKEVFANPHIYGGHFACVEEDGEIVALCYGEIVGDMLIIHIEKALVSYEGAYQFMFSGFVNKYGAGCRYVNREDDVGSPGLRKSKLQYHPIKIEEYISVDVNTELTRLSEPPKIETERLVLDLISERDEEAYNRLCLDEQHNRYWGYDYREQVTGTPPRDYFWRDAIADYENKVSLTLAIRRGGEFIGEVVINEFDYRGSANLGVRILPEYTGRGYGREALSAAAEYALYKIGLDSVTAYCYKGNTASYRLLSSCMKLESEDEKFYYFQRKA